ncbi:MAG TPA: hypothetical protein VEU31_08935 [Candidatus Acidoferrales bacterium]|nr:hypothetical protein [Candidatus Acidoferrales bacterium]
MARYSALLGHGVEVQYRAGDLLLPAKGTLRADSGRSIFLEQKIEQRGQVKTFRWEIPYPCIVRIEPQKTTLAAMVGASSSQAASAIAEEVSAIPRNGRK